VIAFSEVNHKWLEQLGQSAREMCDYMANYGSKPCYPRLQRKGLRRCLHLEPLTLPGPHHWFNGLFLRDIPDPRPLTSDL
jgi:hypothetical protein